MNVFLRILAVCAAAIALHIAAAAERNAQPANQSAQASSVKRTILRRLDVPNSNYEVVLVQVDAPAHSSAGRHTHPGAVMGYVVEGEYTMLIEGRPPQTLKPGESLEVPSGVVHDEKTGARPATLLAVFTVEKGKPLATPAN